MRGVLLRSFVPIDFFVHYYYTLLLLIGRLTFNTRRRQINDCCVDNKVFVGRRHLVGYFLVLFWRSKEDRNDLEEKTTRQRSRKCQRLFEFLAGKANRGVGLIFSHFDNFGEITLQYWIRHHAILGLRNPKLHTAYAYTVRNPKLHTAYAYTVPGIHIEYSDFQLPQRDFRLREITQIASRKSSLSTSLFQLSFRSCFENISILC